MIGFTSQMTTKYIVIIKAVETAMQDYFGSDDFASTKSAYELAKGQGNLEWIALVSRNRNPGDPNNYYHAKLFCDNRSNFGQISGTCGALINTLNADWF